MEDLTSGDLAAMPAHLYALLTWTTDARLPHVTAEVATFLGRFLPAEAQRRGARVLALGIVRDHVHMLVSLPSVIDVPRLVQGLKGASARIANRDGVAQHPLKWASGYDLRSLGRTQLPAAIRYVRNQKGRYPESAEDVLQHASRSAEPAL